MRIKVDIFLLQRQSHVIESFGEDIELVIDSGQSEYGLESTIIDLSTEKNLDQKTGCNR